MQTTEPFVLVGPADRSEEQYTKPLPEPEVGLRLMRAFLRIRNEALREAIIKFIEELSTSSDKGV